MLSLKVTEMKKDKQKVYSIGTIDFLEPTEESIGKIDLGGKVSVCEVEVRSEHRPFPHFHINGTRGRKFFCAPYIYEPLYFNHDKYVDQLNDQQKKILISWLNQQNKDDASKTNWEMICQRWIDCGNMLAAVPKNPVQPDYTQLKNGHKTK